MSGKRKAGIFLVLLLFFAVYLQVEHMDIHKTPGESNIKNDVSSSNRDTSPSNRNNNPPEPKIDVMIDPGHGGRDTGVDKGGITESEVTLDISKKLKAILEEKSYAVEMTRSTDTSLYQLSDISGTLQRKELDARVNIINKSGAKIFTSIHVDSYPEYPGLSGSIAYYNLQKPQSKDLSVCIQKQLNSISTANLKRGTYDSREADFYLLKNADIPGVLIETAFVTNPTDRKLLSKDTFRSELAKAIADGIENYLATQ